MSRASTVNQAAVSVGRLVKLAKSFSLIYHCNYRHQVITHVSPLQATTTTNNISIIITGAKPRRP